jgi:hypothetical protein
MTEADLLPSTKPLQKVDRALVLQFQRKLGSKLYAAITMLQDVSFVATRLARFSANPGREHKEAIDGVIHLRHTCKGSMLRRRRQRRRRRWNTII